MWNNTRATQILGIKYPIIQGPFGGNFSSANLVATVSNLGGMGSFGLNAYDADEILKVNNDIKALTTNPYALNLWVPLKNDPADSYQHEEFKLLKKHFASYFDALNIPVPAEHQLSNLNFDAQVEAVLSARPTVMSFIFGVPSKEILSEAKRAEIITIGTVTTLDEALAVEEAGMDLIVASGSQAGGHRASFLSDARESLTDTTVLLNQIIPKVKIPVIAAGGISDGRAVAAALSLGASAVQIGTAFLATQESNAPVDHKRRLLAKEGYKTSLTEVYTGRLARVISNTFTKDFETYGDLKVAPYPIQSKFLSSLMQAYREQRREDYLAYYAGQPSAVLQHQSAAELFKSLLREIPTQNPEKA